MDQHDQGTGSGFEKVNLACYHFAHTPFSPQKGRQAPFAFRGLAAAQLNFRDVGLRAPTAKQRGTRDAIALLQFLL